MPDTSPIPPPPPLAMSSSAPGPTPSPLPPRPGSADKHEKPPSPTATRPRPHPRPTPKLLLQINDLSSVGAQDFLSAIHASEVLQSAVTCVLTHLYPSAHASPIPGTRSVTLVVRSMDGVAYTTSKDIDSDHKEIHLSTTYIEGIAAKRKRDELLGVITHEMVHCWQWNGLGTAPGGLIEGIADWVRLTAGFAPPHWTRKPGGRWDAGYQNTGYFLDYLEHRFGAGSVRKVNDNLRSGKYDETSFWKNVFGQPVETLWESYQEKLKKELEVEEEPVIVEKHDGEETLREDASDTSDKSESQKERKPPSYLF